jgi:hypothetical protein
MAGRVISWCVAVAVMLSVGRVSTVAARQAAQNPPTIVYDIPPMADRLLIDGSKNPEMIPQWDAWQATFEVFADSRVLPTVLYPFLTPKEVELVLAAGREFSSNQRGCVEKLKKLLPILKTDEAKYINERTQELNLECRWQTLRLRDRLLADLGPQGQGGMNQFVESVKKGIRVSVPKNELAFYMKPQ